MSKFTFVMRKLKAGAKVRIIQDRYGQRRVEVARSWLPGNTLVNLDRDEMGSVELALGERRHGEAPARTVKLTN